jgi:AraC-like DNA-binding protein
MKASTRGAARPDSGRFMLIGQERVLYAGLLGRPKERNLCAPSIYAATRGALHLTTRDGRRETADCFLVPAFAAHRIEADDANILNLILEPESVDPRALADAGFDDSEPVAGDLGDAMRAGCCARRRAAGAPALTTAAIDHAFLGVVLAPRRLDPRIARVIADLRGSADYNTPASACAASVNLSMSRFLHLFKDETDTPFRTFRAWKRARRLLSFANAPANLAHLALDIGYPDSTHFSHSIRKFYGLKPSAIMSGSRDLAIYQA